MRAITRDTWTALLDEASIRPRLQSQLRFSVPADGWEAIELASITDRTGNKGVLLLQPRSVLYITGYELSRGIANTVTGRSQPIICDFCKTLQAGTNAASISFRLPGRALHTVSYLCCADLLCSKHVRNQTIQGTLSRAQLREDLDDAQRIERLCLRLEQLIEDLKLKATNESTTH